MSSPPNKQVPQDRNQTQPDQRTQAPSRHSTDSSDLEPVAAAMCKHILNAQVAIRSPCCRKWFDCAECHQETADHQLMQSFDMTFACKKCKKCFRKDAREFEESDEYCPHCDNHFVLEAKTPQPQLKVEGEDVRKDSRMLKDERVRGDEDRTIFDVKDAPNRLG